VVWEALFRSEIVNLTFFPPPSQFFGSLIRDGFEVTAGLEKADIGQAVISSIGRVAAGLALAFFLSLGTGVLVTRYPLATLLMPLIRMIAPIAPLAWVPLAIILFGTTEKSAIFIVFMGTYPTLSIAAAASIEQIPRDLLDVAATLGARGTKLWRFVILPSVLPSVFLMLRLNLIAAWMALLAGESVSLRNGLGGVVIVGRESVAPNMVMSGVALIAIVGFAMDQVLLFVQSRLLWRRGAFTL
jgi:NitT/TauT family transport system permease protein